MDTNNINPVRELYELKRAYQMLQIEREGVYMGVGTCNTKHHNTKTCTIDKDGLKAIQARINELQRAA